MGQFSWLDCKTKKQIVNGRRKSVYVLVPKEFGGGHIREGVYDGYGDFGGHDIYDLVADWNKESATFEHIATSPEWSFANIARDAIIFGASEYWETHGASILKRFLYICRRMSDWQSGWSDEDMNMKYGFDWKRAIGIDIACYDEQNKALKYPIKITYDADAVYEDCEPSDSDPNQGWRC